jgi:hypothetical protein
MCSCSAVVGWIVPQIQTHVFLSILPSLSWHECIVQELCRANHTFASSRAIYTVHQQCQVNDTLGGSYLLQLCTLFLLSDGVDLQL